MSGRDRRVARVWAWCALLSAIGVAVALVWLLVADVVTLALVLVSLGVAAALGWVALTRRGTLRSLAAVLTVVALAGGVVAMVVRGAVDELVGVVVAGAAFAVTALAAIRASRRQMVRPVGSPANSSRPRRAGKAVLLMNPRSGGARVERFDLVAEAERRGIEAVMLQPGDDLSALAREAAGSAEVVGMAGGDGSQAVVAQAAMEHDVDFVCVPAGTRNHLALDLGLDRDDVVGALEAFTSGIERTIDLAFVNGRVFVNNVSLGIYAEIVQSGAYRDAKLETAEKMLPELLGPNATPFDLRFLGDGGEERSAQLLLVSNNPYVLDSFGGFGSRPRMDTGKLGIVAVEVHGAAAAAKLAVLEALRQVRRFDGWDEWTAESFQVDSGSPVAAGIDGEAVVLEPPLRFTITPAALRVRLPPTAVGLSPAALRPRLSGASLRELWGIATARS